MSEARDKAKESKVDLVLRNDKMDPPIVKIMNYRKELLKVRFRMSIIFLETIPKDRKRNTTKNK
jgi:translation initiation factor IF-3